MKKGTGEKVFKMVGLILLIVSFAVFIYTVKLGIETSRQSKWPRVEGSIIKAEFEKIVIQPEDRTRPKPMREKAIWKPHFEYTYEAYGKKHTSQQISTFDSTCDSESQVLDLKRLVSKKETVVVYFDPANPGFSVINPYPSLLTTWSLLVGSVLVGFVGLGIFWLCRDS